MRRFTVMGFTEAELGFVLAAVFAALAVSAINDRAHQESALETTNRTLRAERDSLAGALKAFRDSLPKRSNKTPRCTEKGEPADPVADLRIVGRDAYVMNGQRLTFADLQTRLAPQVERSKSLGCHYLVRTRATSGVDGPLHSAAVRRLWALFDVDDRDR
jgi:hypothetical protein